jgi:hypothetical protein
MATADPGEYSKVAASHMHHCESSGYVEADRMTAQGCVSTIMCAWNYTGIAVHCAAFNALPLLQSHEL